MDVEKDSPTDGKEIWFKAKKYGYGWYPVTWQGWIVLLVYLVLITIVLTGIYARSHSLSDTLVSFAFFFVPATLIFLAICHHKGEIARWRWGEKEEAK